MKEYTVQLSDKGTVAVDDTILVKDAQSAAGSRIMEGFKPLFSAQIVGFLDRSKQSSKKIRKCHYLFSMAPQ